MLEIPKNKCTLPGKLYKHSLRNTLAKNKAILLIKIHTNIYLNCV